MGTKFEDLSVEEQSELRRKRIEFLEGVVARFYSFTTTEDDLELGKNLHESV